MLRLRSISSFVVLSITRSMGSFIAFFGRHGHFPVSLGTPTNDAWLFTCTRPSGFSPTLSRHPLGQCLARGLPPSSPCSHLPRVPRNKQAIVRSLTQDQCKLKRLSPPLSDPRNTVNPKPALVRREASQALAIGNTVQITAQCIVHSFFPFLFQKVFYSELPPFSLIC